jgi:hypothetical protein
MSNTIRIVITIELSERASWRQPYTKNVWFEAMRSRVAMRTNDPLLSLVRQRSGQSPLPDLDCRQYSRLQQVDATECDVSVKGERWTLRRMSELRRAESAESPSQEGRGLVVDAVGRAGVGCSCVRCHSVAAAVPGLPWRSGCSEGGRGDTRLGGSAAGVTPSDSDWRGRAGAS